MGCDARMSAALNLVYVWHAGLRMSPNHCMRMMLAVRQQHVRVLAGLLLSPPSLRC